MRIVRAKPADAVTLTGIAISAKAHWGYPATWMRQWTAALTITPEYIVEHPTYAAIRGGRIVGFYALCVKRGEAWLDHLWVLPTAIKSGIGRALFGHAAKVARTGGAVRLKIESDPNAEGFYQRMGARTIGRQRAPVDGHERFLPLLEKTLV
jgi:GNAT superfamily N-acetyltransferase